MTDTSFLEWPFLSKSHKDLYFKLEDWAENNLKDLDHNNVDNTCKLLVSKLGSAGFLNYSGISEENPKVDVRSLCLIRETLAKHDGLADFSFAMQGLGSMPISLHGNLEQQKFWLPKIQSGHAISAFALSEPRSGSDVANLELMAKRERNGYVLNGEKTWISNGGIADVYTVFARTGEGPGAKGLSAFIVPANTPGLLIKERIEAVSPHPLATLSFENLFLDADAMIGQPGDGFKIAMASLDNMRSTVGAAALGFARRAFQESVTRSKSRVLFGAPLGDLQMIQGHLADMCVDIDASALLIYRAAWVKDSGAERITKEAAIAKLYATERAQVVIDKAVQIHGGDGVRKGHIVESLYREIRALRIYEGATDVQKIIIARNALSSN
ncbi:MAG: acyl-CoA dehydrogenase [Rhodobacteraceae bacterium]|nr:MAG: acyl-CoA dehydrogenase [Paracoccaceae bacterium]